MDKLKIYEDVIDKKWQCLDNVELYGDWIKLKDRRIQEGAGSGLAVATVLLLREIGLQLSSRLILWSPWVDLACSMPSFWNTEMDKTDFFGASNPSKFQFPKYATMNFTNSPFKKPTKVMLEVYNETNVSIIRSCDFIKNILNKNIPDEADSKSFQGIHKNITAIAINPNCKIRELDENF
ncbi:6672_t:CDS:2 [Dentiscutata erythropus]|uniref:6672_t:CDS:1 n=1 Tax=Dentiscutata erythropus TaxID=1348616 RepID=A0A9N9ELW6_9GLOM|nr:6672_t:CDS:2 [Dentiscutata erythropus]